MNASIQRLFRETGRAGLLAVLCAAGQGVEYVCQGDCFDDGSKLCRFAATARFAEGIH